MAAPRGLLRAAEWSVLAAAHRHRLAGIIAPGLVDAEAQPFQLDAKHPVYNFLVTYYYFAKPKDVRRLQRWSPGAGCALELDEHDEHGPASGSAHLWNRFVAEGDDDAGAGAAVQSGAPTRWQVHRLPAKFRPQVEDMLALLETTRSNRPVLNCFGLHEWAMVHRPAGAPEPPSRRFQAHLPLRVPQDVVNDVVERNGVACSHWDAMRFFAPSAVPLSKNHGLGREEARKLENPACLHANMDLFKVAWRLGPLAPSEVLLDALQVNLDARRVDVAASPYDASAYGVAPIPIETREGRAQYRVEQLALMRKAEPVREALAVLMRRLLQENV